MLLALVLLGTASLLEILLFPMVSASLRHGMAAGLCGIISFATVWLLINDLALWSVVISLFSVYRVINLFRLVADKRPLAYLHQVWWRSSLWLSVLQLGCFIIQQTDHFFGWTNAEVWYAAAAVQLSAAVVLLLSTLRHERTTRVYSQPGPRSDHDLPSLSVLIPARNETDDLSACLKSLITSTYPKLEIVVLDDCSVTRRTPEIIRGFAHDGVQFINGSPPPDHWLAKNYAYQELLDKANGDLLLFCGVDTRFGPDSLKMVVETLLDRHKTMLSLLPSNRQPESFAQSFSAVQTNRYAWELALPRRLFRRPPVLSTCWLINREQLSSAGGFKAVRQSVIPERYFAHYCATHADGYSFLQSNSWIDISCAKAVSEQQATALRTRYPELHQKLELTAFVTAAELVCLLGPVVGLLHAIADQNLALLLLSGVAALTLIAVYSRISALTYRHFYVQSVLIALIAEFVDIWLMNFSLWQYEFGEVLWKGRNICLPIMQVFPTLPPLKDPEITSDSG